MVQGSFFLIRRDLWERLGGFDLDLRDVRRGGRPLPPRPRRRRPAADDPGGHDRPLPRRLLARAPTREIMTLKAQGDDDPPPPARPGSSRSALFLLGLWPWTPHGQRRHPGAADRPRRPSPRPRRTGARSGGPAPTGCRGYPPQPGAAPPEAQPAAGRGGGRVGTVGARPRRAARFCRPARLGEHRDEHDAVGIEREGALEQQPRQSAVEVPCPAGRQRRPERRIGGGAGLSAARLPSTPKTECTIAPKPAAGGARAGPRPARPAPAAPAAPPRRGRRWRSRRARPPRRSPPPPPGPCRTARIVLERAQHRLVGQRRGRRRRAARRGRDGRCRDGAGSPRASRCSSSGVSGRACGRLHPGAAQERRAAPAPPAPPGAPPASAPP